VTLGTTLRRSLRLQSQRNSPRHLNAETPQGLRTVQGEFVTRHSDGTTRPIQSSCTHHRRLHVRHGCRAAATRPERPAAFFHKKLNLKGKITPTPLPPTSTQQSTQPRQRHYRPSHELYAPKATHAALFDSTAEHPSPRRWGDVGTALINSDAGQSQFRSHPMLSNGRISTFPFPWM
jgi:hypothetical protein